MIADIRTGLAVRPPEVCDADATGQAAEGQAAEVGQARAGAKIRQQQGNTLRAGYAAPHAVEAGAGLTEAGNGRATKEEGVHMTNAEPKVRRELPDWLRDDDARLPAPAWTPGPGWVWRKVCPDCGTLVVPRAARSVDWDRHRAAGNCLRMAALMRSR